MIYLSALVLSMFLTIAIIPITRDMAGRYRALDMPGGRKIHHRPIPKCGGVSMIFGALLPILIWTPGGAFIRSILIGSWIIVIFGLIDDVKDLSYGLKFIGQLLAASVVIFYGGLIFKDFGSIIPGTSQLSSYLAIPITFVIIVGVTNAINLSDGLDGLAGGISLLSFMCIGYLAYMDGAIGLVVVCTAMIGAIIGFLRFNTHPASIFMGDTGSQLLGFLAITLSLNLTQNNNEISNVLPLLIMGLPILDTLRVIVDRLASGKSPFEADTRHLHHRLMEFGLYHSEAVLTIYFLHAVIVTIAFLIRFKSDWLSLLIYVIYSAVIIASVEGITKTGWRRRRYDFFDKILKTKLRQIKEKKIFIKIFFKLLEVGAPLIFLVTSLVSTTIPKYVSLASATFGFFLLTVRMFKPKLTGFAIRLAIYLLVPFVIYQSELTPADWANVQFLRGYNILFAVTALLVVLVLKFTRRKSGFKSTPMDFLILFIALVIPNIPDEQIRSYQMGMVAAKIICIYFGFEVLIGELRGEFERVSNGIILTLLIICGRGFLVM
jgi:UDP-GlcNAc:undecaprenyl-phosphate GlcNAc-1-phosphate transferase